MRAVILAAGRGTHMSLCPQGVPACMLSFGDTTLLERQLKSLAECGISADEVSIVVGYGADKVKAAPDVSIIRNNRYASTDNSYSLRLALEALSGIDDEIVVLDANIVIRPGILEEMLRDGRSSVLVQGTGSSVSRTGVLVDSDDRVIAIGKHLAAADHAFGGILVLENKDRVLLLDRLQAGGYDQNWYAVPLNALLQEIEVGAFVVERGTVKVSTDEDYFYAKRAFGIDKLSVLLVGAGGFLGKKMKSLLSRCYDVTGTSRAGMDSLVALDPLDAERTQAVFELLKPDVVVNLVGYADPDACNENQDLAYDLNVRVVENLSAACRAHQASLVQISTDYVFDGSSLEPYEIDSPRRPKSFYGHTKMMAEDVAKGVRGSLIVRIPVLYGRNGVGDKKTFPSNVVDRLKSGEMVECDDEQVRYPVLTDDVCEAVRLHILDTGVLHVSSSTPVTKYAWAKLIAREYGLDEALVTRGESPVRPNRPMHVRLSLSEKGFEARGIDVGTSVLRHQQSCSFELVYKQAPLSMVENVRVADFRIRLGRALARNMDVIPDDIDYIVPVPESGLYYAMGFSEYSKIPYLQALIKQNRLKRSFQLASIEDREAVLKDNIVPIKELIEGKHVALIDEAIFTGITMRTLCDEVKACGALSVDVFIPTPVCATRCAYGVQPHRAMLAESVPVDSMSEHFRIRSIHFGDWGVFSCLTGEADPKICTECFAPRAEGFGSGSL